MPYKKVFISCWYLWGLLFPIKPLYSFAYPYERMEIVSDLERDDKSFKIITYNILRPIDDKIFIPHYWKVYYQQDKIVGEELFEKGKMTYYYVYFYDQNKVYQKGFFWYGIYYDIGVFKAHDKKIKQGWIYKNLPDCYRVFNLKNNQLIYEYYYPNKEI